MIKINYDNYVDVLYIKKIGLKYKGSYSIEEDNESWLIDKDVNGEVSGLLIIDPCIESLACIKRNADKIPCDVYNAYVIWHSVYQKKLDETQHL